MVSLFDEALRALRVPGYRNLVNDRRIFAGIAASIGVGTDRLTDWTVAVDKHDKVGLDGVCDELERRGFDGGVQEGTRRLFGMTASGVAGMEALLAEFNHPQVQEGGASLTSLWALATSEGIGEPELVFAPGLARGLNYYTGAIFEVQVVDAPVGSICGGGRYDDLTGIFGMPGVSGVGISFGADRIYDVLEHVDAFPPEQGLRSEVYPDAAKLKKQFKYADDRQVPYVLVLGSDEVEAGTCTLRDMRSGEQVTQPLDQVMDRLDS